MSRHPLVDNFNKTREEAQNNGQKYIIVILKNGTKSEKMPICVPREKVLSPDINNGQFSLYHGEVGFPIYSQNEEDILYFKGCD